MRLRWGEPTCSPKRAAKKRKNDVVYFFFATQRNVTQRNAMQRNVETRCIASLPIRNEKNQNFISAHEKSIRPRKINPPTKTKDKAKSKGIIDLFADV